MKSVVSVFGLTPRRIGGIESFARELSVQLQALGWRSVLVFTGAPAPDVECYLSSPNVSLEVAPELAALGWSGMTRCAALLRRYRPAIFHFHFLSPISPFPWLARMQRTERVFFSDHGPHSEDELLRKKPALKRLAGRLITWPITGWLCVSHRNLICSRAAGYLREDRFHVLHNGVALPAMGRSVELGLRFRRRFGIPLDRQLVVQVGLIVPGKGVTDVLEAARLVLRQQPGAHFAFVGDGSHSAEYREFARHLGIEHAVTWTGLSANPTADGAYAAADVVCLASRLQEAFPLVVIEGMAFGRPVVATAVGGIPDAVEDGVTGYLVPREDPPALVGRLLQLLADPELRRRMGARARQAVEDRFQLSDQVRNLLRNHYRVA
jgi:glycosyltransferase involved in cell wall biosynthesis